VCGVVCGLMASVVPTTPESNDIAELACRSSLTSFKPPGGWVGPSTCASRAWGRRELRWAAACAQLPAAEETRGNACRVTPIDSPLPAASLPG